MATTKQSRQMPQIATKSNGQAKTPPHHRKRQGTAKERPKTARTRDSDNGKARNGNQTPKTSPPQPPRQPNGRTDEQPTDTNGTSHTAQPKAPHGGNIRAQRRTAENRKNTQNHARQTLLISIYIYYIMSNNAPKVNESDFVFFLKTLLKSVDKVSLLWYFVYADVGQRNEI